MKLSILKTITAFYSFAVACSGNLVNNETKQVLDLNQKIDRVALERISGSVDNYGKEDKILESLKAEYFAKLLDIIHKSLQETVERKIRISESCDNSLMEMAHLKNTTDGSQPASPVSAFDFSGKIVDGMTQGNVLLVGRFEDCLDSPKLNYFLNTIKVGTNSSKTINGVTTYEMKAAPIPLIWGMCLPNSCSLHDVNNLSKFLVSGITIPIPTGVDDEVANGGVMDITTVYGVEESPIFENSGATAALALCFAFLLLNFLGTVCDISITRYLDFIEGDRHKGLLQDYEEIKYNGDLDDESESFSSSEISSEDDTYDNSLEGEKRPLLQVGGEKPKEEDTGFNWVKIRNIARIFSIAHNFSKLTSPAGKEFSHLRCLNGIRVISILWIMLGHSIYYAMVSGAEADILREMAYSSKLSFQIISNAFFGVDSFFFLGGFLAMYLMLQKIELAKFNVGQLIGIYWHRYWRITPIYLFLLVIWCNLSPYLIEGPFRNSILGYNKTCKQMWVNILYLGNFDITGNDFQQCLPHAWYLNNDMQFFWITPPLVVLTLYKKYWGLFSLVFLLVASWVYTMVIEFHYEYPAFFTQAIIAGTEIEKARAGPYWTSVYIQPWTRFGPYAIGLICGWMLNFYPNLSFAQKVVRSFHSILGFKRKMTLRIFEKLFMYSVFVLTFAMMSFLVLCSKAEYVGTPSFTLNLIYITFARTVWGICLGIFIFGCARYGGWINRFLGHDVFTFPGRIGLSVYLVHPLMMQVIYSGNNYPSHFNMSERILVFSGFATLSYIAATLLTLLVESPLINVEKFIMSLLSKKK